jgi:hypothetical protein
MTATIGKKGRKLVRWNPYRHSGLMAAKNQSDMRSMRAADYNMEPMSHRVRVDSLSVLGDVLLKNRRGVCHGVYCP